MEHQRRRIGMGTTDRRDQFDPRAKGDSVGEPCADRLAGPDGRSDEWDRVMGSSAQANYLALNSAFIMIYCAYNIILRR